MKLALRHTLPPGSSLVQALSMGGLLLTAPPPVRAIPFDLTGATA
jgi:hypothetical protein